MSATEAIPMPQEARGILEEEPDWFVWSTAARAWLAKDRKNHSKRLTGAGRFTHTDALDICIQAMAEVGGLGALPVWSGHIDAMLSAWPIVRKTP